MISVMICRSPKYGIVKAAKEVFWGSQQKKVVLQHSGLLQNFISWSYYLIENKT